MTSDQTRVVGGRNSRSSASSSAAARRGNAIRQNRIRKIPQTDEKDFVRRNIRLAADGGSRVQMTDDEKRRVKELLHDLDTLDEAPEEEAEEETRMVMENPHQFSIEAVEMDGLGNANNGCSAVNGRISSGGGKKGSKSKGMSALSTGNAKELRKESQLVIARIGPHVVAAIDGAGYSLNGDERRRVIDIDSRLATLRITEPNLPELLPHSTTSNLLGLGAAEDPETSLRELDEQLSRLSSVSDETMNDEEQRPSRMSRKQLDSLLAECARESAVLKAKSLRTGSEDFEGEEEEHASLENGAGKRSISAGSDPYHLDREILRRLLLNPRYTPLGDFDSSLNEHALSDRSSQSNDGVLAIGLTPETGPADLSVKPKKDKCSSDLAVINITTLENTDDNFNNNSTSIYVGDASAHVETAGKFDNSMQLSISTKKKSKPNSGEQIADLKQSSNGVHSTAINKEHPVLTNAFENKSRSPCKTDRSIDSTLRSSSTYGISNTNSSRMSSAASSVNNKNPRRTSVPSGRSDSSETATGRRVDTGVHQARRAAVRRDTVLHRSNSIGCFALRSTAASPISRSLDDSDVPAADRYRKRHFLPPIRATEGFVSTARPRLNQNRSLDTAGNLIGSPLRVLQPLSNRNQARGTPLLVWEGTGGHSLVAAISTYSEADSVNGAEIVSIAKQKS